MIAAKLCTVIGLVCKVQNLALALIVSEGITKHKI